LNVQLFADSEYQQSLVDYVDTVDGLERNEPAVIVLDFSFLHPSEKVERLSKLDTSVPIVCNTLIMSATTAKHISPENAQIIGMPILPHYFVRQKIVEYSLPIGVTAVPEVLAQFLAAIGKGGEKINDSIAGVFPRTLAMIVNEAAFAVQESVATAEDIDTAMKLGTNYPKGPLAWCDEIGAEAIVAILDALAREYGSERYRVATLLRRYAESGQQFIPSSH